jgi:LacI family transcriptional regulator
LEIETISNVAEGRKSARELLGRDRPPDAIFSSSDFAALGALQEIRERGLGIPEDICIVGFSNEPFTKFMELTITSVDQFPMEMGKVAAQVFLEEVSNTKDNKITKNIVLTPELIVRESSLKT